jgi:thiol-disulfide isomerase/thioredoxin
MKWMMVSASWCAACLIMKKRMKQLQSELELEFEILDVDYDDQALSGLEIGKILPVIYRKDDTGYHKLSVGEQSLEQLRKVYQDALS